MSWGGSSGTPPCTGGAISGTTITTPYAAYAIVYGYDTIDRLTTSWNGSYTYGDAAHVHAATAIGTSGAASFRRPARDYERLATTLAALHFLAFACLMLHRFTLLM